MVNTQNQDKLSTVPWAILRSWNVTVNVNVDILYFATTKEKQNTANHFFQYILNCISIFTDFGTCHSKHLYKN